MPSVTLPLHPVSMDKSTDTDNNSAAVFFLFFIILLFLLYSHSFFRLSVTTFPGALLLYCTKEQYELVHAAGGMVIHAHPYREEDYIPEVRLFPEWVDGVEGINATHSSSISLPVLRPHALPSAV